MTWFVGVCDSSSWWRKDKIFAILLENKYILKGKTVNIMCTPNEDTYLLYYKLRNCPKEDNLRGGMILQFSKCVRSCKIFMKFHQKDEEIENL